MPILVVQHDGAAVCESFQTGYDLIDRFITAETSDDETKFISIVPADEANDIIQVLVR